MKFVLIANQIMKRETKEKRRKDTQLRRNTMKATMLTIIALAATAIVFGGCSTDNPVLGPQTDLQTESTINNNRGRIAVDADNNPEPESFTITAKVVSLDFENGCYYLQSNDGKTFTPVAPIELELKSGMKLKAEGHIDSKIQFFCGNGPAFVIEHYSILENGKMYRDDSVILTELDEDRAQNRYNEDRYSEETNTMQEELKKKSEEEARFSEPQNEEAPPVDINDNKNQRFSAPSDRYSEEDAIARELELKKKLEEERHSSEPSNEEAPPTMTDNDDNERDLGSPEDRISQEELRRIEMELKKKLEEEMNGQESGNERP
jgi:hypothetical protein